SVKPALSGRYQARSLSGELSVRPVLDIVHEILNRNYTPDQASRVCGTPPGIIRRLARMIIEARSVSGVAGSSIPKLYHGDLIMRAQILVYTLGGHLGRAGAGFDTCPFLLLDGLGHVGASQLEGLAKKLKFAPTFLKRRIQGETTERIVYDALRDYMDTNNIVSSVLYWRHHGGLLERTDADWGRKLPRPVGDYLAESYARGWQRKPPEKPPRVLLIAGSNLLRRLRSADLLLSKVWPRIDLVVTTELRMTTTCLQSDILLPGAGSYEKDDVTNWHTLLSPYLHITQAAVSPLADTKAEWEIHSRLAYWIEKRAKERGLHSFRGRDGKQHPLEDFYSRFTFGGKFGDNGQSDVARDIVAKTSFLDKSFDEMRSTGFARVTGIGRHPINLGNATEVRPNAPVINREWRRTKPGPWPTLTRRIQFYIDHPLYLELGEELPTHKEPPASGGNYPLVLTGGHTRWSIHAGWRNLDLLLQLPRGEAAAFVAKADAEARDIRDGVSIRLWNDVGEFVVRAKVSSAVRPGTVILYHAWEDYQFRSAKGYRNVLPSPLNPVELAGGYNHLRPVPTSLQPGQSDRETRVEIEAA
ncbi:MAG: molybdopterin dinucleotide binding domain-containing protein, partial [Candidatus Binatia bacterium]